MKRNLYIWVVTACMTVLVQACESYLDKQPLSGPSDVSYFTSQNDLVIAVNGCYKIINFAPLDNIPMNLVLDNGTDIGWDRNNSALQALGLGNQDSNNGFSQSVWKNAYSAIARCNFILDNMDKVKDKMDESLFKRCRAEVRFIRAYVYQYMIDFFGGVPLVTHVLQLSEAQIPRNSKEEILSFVFSELDEAAADLPLTYSGNDIGRATRGAALAIKARAALNNEKWDIAAAASKAVMDLNLYSLHTNFGELFSYKGESSKEIIFASQFLKGTVVHSTPFNLLSRNGQGASNKVPSQSLVDAYECIDGLTIDKSPLFDPAHPYQNRDPRLGFTVALPGSVFYNYQFETHKDSVKCWNYNVTPATRITNQEATNAYASFTGYCWKKYVDLQDKDDRQNSELNVIQIRYAEVLLIYAEAMIEAGKIDESVYTAINAVRQRPSVNMPPITAGKTQAEMRSVVRRERLYELAMEGFRLTDIRRWKIADKAMNGPFYGRIPRGLLSNAPVIDENGIPDYSGVANRDQMRVVEVRTFHSNRDYLWPIPNIETVTDPKIEQNPNY